MKKELFWPLGLMITISGTILFFLLWLIPFSATKMDSLVSDTYYQEGVEYQKIIDRLDRTVSNNKSIQITRNNNTIELQVNPERFEKIKGTLFLKRPNDNAMDKTVPLSFSSDGSQYIPVVTGVWNLSVIWEENHISYQQNEKLIVSRM